MTKSTDILLLKEIFEEVFEIKVSENDFLSMKINDIRQWDSLGHINFLLAVEKRFNVKFKLNEIELFVSIEKIKKFLFQN